MEEKRSLRDNNVVEQVDKAYEEKSNRGEANGGSSLKKTIFDPARGTVLGRTGASWLKIFLFYLIFYGFLAAFFSLMLYVFLLKLDRAYPRHHLEKGIIGNVPGMGFRPIPGLESNLIYLSSENETLKAYANQLHDVLTEYKSLKNEKYSTLCSRYPQTSDYDRVCAVNLNMYSPYCNEANGYGFYEGKPCVMLRLNRLFGWKPENFKSNEVPREIEDFYRRNHITVKCEGENAVDKTSVGDIQYTPRSGLPFFYFPYLNQKSYQNPFVFAKFNSLKKGVIVFVTCKAYASNIHHDEPGTFPKFFGSVHLEILSDF